MFCSFPSNCLYTCIFMTMRPAKIKQVICPYSRKNTPKGDYSPPQKTNKKKTQELLRQLLQSHSLQICHPCADIAMVRGRGRGRKGQMTSVCRENASPPRKYHHHLHHVLFPIIRLFIIITLIYILLLLLTTVNLS